jgi:phosphodiesterase/alkaline phosphatase D-like protein
MKRRQFLSSTAAGAAGWLAAQQIAGDQPKADGPPTPTAHRSGEPAPTESLPEITWSRKVSVRYEADVAVIGGGIAGVCAPR